MAFWTYLKASYKYRFYRHVRLILIFTCLMFLPLSLSIYRDSMVHGVELYNRRPQEYDLLIFHAGDEHLPYFEHIPYLDFSVYEDFIGVNVHEEAQISASTAHLSDAWEVWGAVEVYGALLTEIIDEIRSDGYADVYLSSGHPGKTELNAFGDILLMFAVILLAASAGAWVYAGRSHIKLFLPDIGMMSAYGAEKKHVRRILIAEFMLAFLLSALLAVGLSSLLMRLVITGIVQTTVPGATWVVYDVSLSTTMGIVLAYFMIGAASFALALSKTLKHSSVYLISSADENAELARRKKTITLHELIAALVFILSKRTRSLRGVLAVSVLLIAAIVAMFNFMANLIYYEFSPSEFHLSVFKNTGYNVTVYEENGWDYESHFIKTPGFAQADTAFVQSLAGVVNVQVQVMEDHFLDRMHIQLDDARKADDIYHQLTGYFGDFGLYTVHNEAASAEADRDMQTGLYLLTLTVFAVLIAVTAAMIYLRITGYVETQSKNICVLRTLGAECGDILRAFMAIAFHAATIGVAAAFALGIGAFHVLSYVAYLLFGDQTVMVWTAQAVIIQLSACALIYAVFLWTMYASVGKIINTELHETRRQTAWQ